MAKFFRIFNILEAHPFWFLYVILLFLAAQLPYQKKRERMGKILSMLKILGRFQRFPVCSAFEIGLLRVLLIL